MYRRLIAGLAILWIAVSGQPAWGESERTIERVQAEAVDDQEVGVQLGLGAGGRVTPGGLHISGQYLYRLAAQDWFEGGVGFFFGASDPACFRDRNDSRTCDHGAMDGFAGELSLGVRRFLATPRPYKPYLRAGVALRLVSYSADQVLGVSAPFWVGAGLRTRVNERIAVSGGASAQFGLGWFDQTLGVEPVAALVISVGAEFRLSK